MDSIPKLIFSRGTLPENGNEGKRERESDFIIARIVNNLRELTENPVKIFVQVFPLEKITYHDL